MLDSASELGIAGFGVLATVVAVNIAHGAGREAGQRFCLTAESLLFGLVGACAVAVAVLGQ